jgi:predicted RNA-binding protein with RPS1 domain
VSLTIFADHFKPCQGVRCKVLSIDVDRQALDLSIKALTNETNKAATPDKIKAGMIIPARILRVKLNEGVTVQLFSHTYGRAYITDLFDNYVKDPIAGKSIWYHNIF